MKFRKVILSSIVFLGIQAAADVAVDLSAGLIDLSQIQPGEQKWEPLWDGLHESGYVIPQEGQVVKTKRGSSGYVEKSGTVVPVVTEAKAYAFVKGAVSHYSCRGGEKQFCSKKGLAALTAEPVSKIGRNARDCQSYYVAMRFPYYTDQADEGPKFWANRKLLIINPENAVAVVVRAIDWGPSHTRRNTRGRIIDLSPVVAKLLDIDTDQDALVAFAREDSEIGPVDANFKVAQAACSL